ncbi:MAG: TetR family transcriptional regulator [Lachnospiraceae bacterium]|nr:TetR family transcriptional regulator [Lachnospiraceae bacterium]
MFDSPTKNRIAEAFKTLLKEKPYSSIKVKNIVDLAGVSSMTFYRNFSDKDELTENICFEDLMLFTKIYGSNAELRSITVCMLNTIKSNSGFYGALFKDEDSMDSFMRALSRVSYEATGTKGSATTLSNCKEILQEWANENFATSVDDIYTKWVAEMPLRAVLNEKELAAAIKSFEKRTLEEFRKRYKK